MNPSFTPLPGAQAPCTAPPPAPPQDTSWVGYESALPWIRIPLPLARATPRPR
ncbi:MAG TPA: hypothetical protein VFQ20_05805 [Burkholderiaceae bacterium]|nr:hypothetical protein [Burkholderiaceae bacterium]